MEKLKHYDADLDRGMERHFFGNEQAAERYIRGIRNADKKSYAKVYLGWVLDGRKGHNGPEWDRTKLSYMAAQSVRMNIDGFYPPSGATE